LRRERKYWSDLAVPCCERAERQTYRVKMNPTEALLIRTLVHFLSGKTLAQPTGAAPAICAETATPSPENIAVPCE
jgi:hypothetical protein